MKTYNFEVRTLRNGKDVTLANFKNLIDACNYATRMNDVTLERVDVVRVDLETVVVMDAYPNELKEYVKFKEKHNARNK